MNESGLVHDESHNLCLCLVFLPTKVIASQHPCGEVSPLEPDQNQATQNCHCAAVNGNEMECRKTKKENLQTNSPSLPFVSHKCPSKALKSASVSEVTQDSRTLCHIHIQDMQEKQERGHVQQNMQKNTKDYVT